MRWTIATALCLAALAAAPAAAGPKPASVRVAECSPGDHSAVFYARMRRLPGSVSMALRLTLLERTGQGGFAPVGVPGLARWRKSQPGRAGFAVRQRVRNLTDGAAYRARASFRWKDAKGAVVHSERRTSHSCKLVGRPLPNLRARPIRAQPTNVEGVLRYAVRVVNAGRVAAQLVPVRLSVDGSEVNTRTVAALGPDESMLLFFRGPACERTVAAKADPAGLIPERDETDNGAQVACADLQR
jgi:CARDB protein